MQDIEDAVVAQCEADAAAEGSVCPFSTANPPDIFIDCGSRRRRRNIKHQVGWDEVAHQRDLHEQVAKQVANSFGQLPTSSISSSGGGGGGGGIVERVRRSLSFKVVINLPGVPESSIGTLKEDSVVVAGFVNIITTTTTVSSTTTTVTSTTTTVSATTTSMTATTTTTSITSTTTTVLCKDCATSPNLHAFMVLGLGGELVDRSLAEKSQFGEDSSAYIPVFENIDSGSEESLGSMVQVPWLESPPLMMQRSTLDAFQQLCVTIAEDESLVLSGQQGACSIDTVAKVMYGARPASCNNETLSDLVDGEDIPDVVMWLAVEFVTQLTTGAPSETLVSAHKAFVVHIDTAKASQPGLSSVIMVGSQYEQSYNETLAISGAIWGIVISLGLTLVIVYLFKGSFRLTMLTLAIIVGNLGIIVAIFGWMGWTLGGVEAIALSIIVGTSVDYCLHMMEGFAEAAHGLQAYLHGTSDGRDFCANQAMTTIGVPIISSAITTAGAAVFLSTCNLQILSKFGQILVINVSIAIFLSLTALPASFAWAAPTKIGSLFKRALVPCVVGLLMGLIFLVIWILANTGISVKNASGEDLIKVKPG